MVAKRSLAVHERVVPQMSEVNLGALKRFSSDASTFTEAGLRYIHLPKLGLPTGCTPSEADGLLCMDARDGYPTRLFFSERIATTARTLNWHMTVTVAGTVWHAFSWNGIPSSESLEVLLGHLNAFVS
jgi:hypothetical protein